MFTLYQKRQFIYPDKLIPLPIRQFLSFLIFGRKTFHIAIILTRKKTSRLTFGEKVHSFLGILEKIMPIDRAHLWPRPWFKFVDSLYLLFEL